MAHPVKGVKLLRFALHKTLNPSCGLFGSEQEHSSVYFTGYRAGKSVSLLRNMKMRDGSSVLVLNSSLCNMKCLGVSLLSLDGILVHHRLALVFLSGLPLQLVSTLPLLGWERYWEGQVSCPRAWHSSPSLGSILDPLIWSPSD